MWIIRSEDFHITHTHIYIYFQVVMIVAITFLRNVSGVSLIEIAIKGVPDVPHEDMLEFTKCHTCGEILGEYGESENDDNQWWCWCKCLSEFCPKCSDTFLSDESGLCNECDDPDVAVLRAMKSRKRSKI